MKLKYHFLFLILPFLSCKNNHKDSDLIKKELKGKVKTLEESTFKAIEKFGKITKNGKDSTGYYNSDYKINFNKIGNEISKTKYNNNKEIKYESSKIYDQNNNLLEINSVTKDSGHTSKWTYKYNKAGDIIEKKLYSNKEITDFWTYIYDENGMMIESNWYFGNGNLFLKTINEYVKGAISVSTKYNSEGVFSSSKEFTYNSEKQVVEEINYDKSKKLEMRAKYEYSEDKKILKESFYEPNSIRAISEYKYDENLNPIVINNFFKGKESKTIFYYDYDEMKNWIKKTKVINGKPYQIIERKFEYYE